MPAIFTTEALSQFLPGTWTIRATNFPFWLSGERADGRLNYELSGTDPLIFADTVTYAKPDGAVKKIVGIDRWTGQGFVWHGKGILGLLSSRWTVTGGSDDLNILAIHYDKSLVTPAGIDIIVREGSEPRELRSLVARGTEMFGLTAEDFASLTWLEPERIDTATDTPPTAPKD